LITMILTPLSISSGSWLYAKFTRIPTGREPVTEEISALPASGPAQGMKLAVIAGYGRVGRNIAQGLLDAGIAYTVIELDSELISLFQIGEFGFILAQAGISMGIISTSFYSLILASALITMILTPLSISSGSWLYAKFTRIPTGREPVTEEISALPASGPAQGMKLAVIAGYGRVGRNIAQGLLDAGIAYTVIELDSELISLFQIGEFGFILAQAGISMGIISTSFYSLILASALITMILTPLSISSGSWLYAKFTRIPTGREPVTEEISALPASGPAQGMKLAVIAGYGRVGRNIAQVY
ncbi:unnamed protein product, partial [marine sediment metagenome]